MSEGHSLRARAERLVHEVAKFGAVGAVGFLVNVAIYNLCTLSFGLAPVRSGVISQTVAIATNYLGNRYWTYRHIDKSRIQRETTLFFLFSGIALVLENGILALSHYGFGFESHLADNIAKNVIGLGIGTVFRFWSYRTWVFKVAAHEEDEEERGEARDSEAGSGGAGLDVRGLAAEEQREDRRQLLK